MPAVYMRGGWATGLFFRPGDLPADPSARDDVFIGAMGSPDPYGMQLDGMGRGTTSTSKCVIVSPSRRPGVHIDYLFAQVAVDRPVVDWTRSCGNLAAAAALYAVQEGLVPATGAEPVPVAMWQVNRNEHIQAEVEPGTGRVRLEFRAPGGAHGQGLLPTGEPAAVLTVSGLGAVEVSVVDAANAFLFVRGADLGVPVGTPEDLGNRFGHAEALRRAAAAAAGFPAASGSPRVLLVDPPQDYVDGGGVPVRAADVDVIVRAAAGNRLHHALPTTAAVATAIARVVPGSVVAQLAGAGPATGAVRIGHPSGVASIRPEVVRDADRWRAVRATVELTARRIMTGLVSLPS